MVPILAATASRWYNSIRVRKIPNKKGAKSAFSTFNRERTLAAPAWLVRLKFYAASDGARSVIEKFIAKELKNLPTVRAQLVDQLKVLAGTPIATLRSTQRIEHVRGDIFSFRFSGRDHWIRIYLAFWPNDNDILILLPVIKKQNRLDNDDTKQAERNLALQRARPRPTENP